MACYYPVEAFRRPDGTVVMCERGAIESDFHLPCGRCVGCRLERARQWSVRVMHEASLQDENCFVTLTYDEANLPSGGSLRYRHFQLFMKKLRKAHGPCRFYMCGEYGDQLDRPHYHAALFGLSFREDRTPWARGESGELSYRSAALEKLWPFGFSSVGDLTWSSAAYIARYVMKKVNGDLAVEHYKRLDLSTGEVIVLTPEFTRMSLRPGIGGRWFALYASDVFPHDRVVSRGTEGKPPRYYDLLMQRRDAEMMRRVKDDRLAEGGSRWEDNGHRRLMVKEAVAKARLSFFRRKLKAD